ncbi:MAG: sugar phosphate isomerase/epimerase [Armatimonadota bacterium]|nr:sugar phosphate isomerase/epimerase [Armatimonadota bacterium]MDW8024640.1 sugar phosphate isomerase/epimerase [Armatimonadota bacterium]
MRLATSLNVLFDPKRVTPEMAIERLAKAGFEALDFNFCDWLFDGSPFTGNEWAKWIDGIGRKAKSVGIPITQSHGPIFNKFADDERTRWLTHMSHRSIEAAGMLGAQWIVFEPETISGAFDEAHIAYLRQRNLDWFAELLKTAEKAGVGIALENNADAFLRRERKIRRHYCSVPAELIDLVDAFNHPLIGICWDTGHANIQQLDQPAALRAIGKRLKALHIQDNDGLHDQHVLPFFGTIDWRPIVDALREIEYEGDFTYEVHNSVRPLPDELRDAALKLAVSIGRYLLNERNDEFKPNAR